MSMQRHWYIQTMQFGIAKELILKGADIVTDTNMALAGINKKTLAGFGGTVHCFMADEDRCKNRKRASGRPVPAVSMEMATEIKETFNFCNWKCTDSV